MLSLSYALTPPLQKTLQKIENSRKNIYLTPLSVKLQLQLSWEAIEERAYWSFKLLDLQLKKNHVSDILKSRSNKKLSPVDKQIIAYRRALNYIKYHWIGSGKDFSYLDLTALANELGFSIRLSPSRSSIGRLFEHLTAGYDHPVIQSAVIIIHLYFIDPSNPKILIFSYLASTLPFYKYGYDMRSLLVMEEYWHNNLSTLKGILNQSAKSQTLNLWIEYFAESMVYQLEKLEKKITIKSLPGKNLQSLWQLNERQKKIIELLEIPDSKITNKKVQSLFKISQITASRDLSKLAQLGAVLSLGKGRSVFYTKL